MALRRAAVTDRPEPPPEEVRARSFLVLPFRNVRGIAEDDWLGDAPVMLGDALSQWQEIAIVSDERLYPALRRHGLTPGEVMNEAQLRRVAEETGGWTAVTGEVLRIGSRIRITARALDVATNRIVVRVREQAESEEEIQEIYERIAAALLKTVGIDASEVDLSSVTTASIGALKAYMRGLRHYNRAELRRAREAFEEAVRLDSTFALAYLKLAEGSLYLSWEALSDGTHPAYGHLSRAVALSDRLPPREQRFLRAMDALFHAQFAAAREQLEDLLALDSGDVDVLIALAWLESVDRILLRVDGKMRIRGSLHRANSLAKMAVLLDPSRYVGYGILVENYLTAGGWMMGAVPTAPRESASLPAYLVSMLRYNFPFTALLRDTLELIPLDTDDFFAGAYREERARARSVARTWVERWLAASPSVAEAHMWAARVFELDESYDKALSELATADSLGVETGLENLVARRMVLLAKSGQRTEALELADSLRAAGIFVTDRIFDPFLADYGGATLSLYLANGDWANASGLLEEISSPGQAIAPIIGDIVVFAVCVLMSPKPLRADVVNSIVNSITEYPATRSMEVCARWVTLATAVDADDALREELASKVLDAADSLLVSTERYSFANELAIAAVNIINGTDRIRVRVLATFKRIAELDAENAGYWNSLCWFGSLLGYAADVMVACEQAVTLAPDNGGIRDSRGLARALTGNVAGAIADFEAYVAWTSNAQAGAQRQGWIEALNRDENPFTPEVLASLRRQ